MSPGSSPVGSYGHSLTYDPVTQSTLMMGGHWWIDQDEGFGEGLWEYDYGFDSWTQLEETIRPRTKYWYSYSVNTNTGELIIFGGINAQGFLDETWGYKDGAWTQYTSDPHHQRGNWLPWHMIPSMMLPYFSEDRQALNSVISGRWTAQVTGLSCLEPDQPQRIQKMNQ
ncbi:MAG: hypothetical protein V1710_09530 [Candidatus Bathyarchaeota archaeon]